MKIFRIGITLLLILGTIGWMGYKLSENKDIIDQKATPKVEVITQIPVRVATVIRKEVDNSVSLTGSFEARKELPIIAEAQGRLTSLNIEEGMAVQKGRLMAEIDDTNVRAQMATAQASLDKASKDVERYERLLKAGAVSQQQLEEMQLNMQSMTTNLTSIEQQLKYTVVKSPMTGIVKEVNLEEGSFASPGTVIATIVDVSRLKMVVKVPEDEIVRIRKGQKVEVVADVYPDKTFNGSVTLISVQADEGRKYDVEVEMPNNAKFPLKAGMYGQVKIQPHGKVEESLFVPRNAVVGSVKDAMVYVLNSDNTVTAKNIEAGSELGDMIMVLSGLNQGDFVVTTGQSTGREGHSQNVTSFSPFSSYQFI